VIGGALAAEVAAGLEAGQVDGELPREGRHELHGVVTRTPEVVFEAGVRLNAGAPGARLLCDGCGRARMRGRRCRGSGSGERGRT
jgi:hypothetical protein